MESKYLPAHIANYLLWKADNENINNITTMKLIKLVYFSYAWNLAMYNEKLFSEHIEAWRYGPVIPSLYHEFKRFGANAITNYAIDFQPETGEISYPIIFADDERTFKVIDAVWLNYKNKNGLELSKITHEPESPWCHAHAQGENTPMEDTKIIVRAEEAIKKFLDSMSEEDINKFLN